MDPETLRRLSPLLDEALEIDAADRESWIAALPEQHADLVATLRDLLFQHPLDGRESMLDAGAASRLQPTQQAGSAFRSGAMVGPYRLLDVLGLGGMGEVWLAERADGGLKRHVAVKLPVVHARRAVLEQRFGRERDILSALTHPHIARLYDAGVTFDGQPFLVLEYVQGVPITQYAEAHALDARQRVQLLCQVIDAVDYAHHNKVIHRDIKPTNVLVTAEGRAMLLDFGIATLLDEGSEQSQVSDLTRIGGAALTLHYAAPEQFVGTPVSVSTDVWALGILLHELMTGTWPFHSDNRPALEHMVISDEPQWPSRRHSGAMVALTARAAAAMDAIVMKTLRKEGSQRYGSAGALSEDLGRWLNDEPVFARPENLVARLNRQLRSRARLTVARVVLISLTTAVLAVVGLGGVEALVSGAQRMVRYEPDSPLSIMVLPFKNATGDPQQDYLADAVTVSLTSELARIRDAFIVSTATAMGLKGKNADLHAIGVELGVRFVLTGNVQHSGDKLRINAQLADTATNAQLWTQSFEGEVVDMLAWQDSVTTQIANSIAPEMIVAAVRTRGTAASNSEIADLTLHALALDLKPESLDNLRDMEMLYRRMLLRAPENARAMGRLSRVLALQAVNYANTMDAETYAAKTLEAYQWATQTRLLDPQSTEIFSAIANYARSQNDFAAARRAGENWIELEPKNSRAYVLLAYDRYFNVEPQKVISLLNQAISLHPKIMSSSDAIFRSMGRAYFMAGDDSSAIVWLQRALDSNPNSSFAYQWLALAYARQGQLEKARQAADRMRTLNPLRNLRSERGFPNAPPHFNQWMKTAVVPAWRKAGLPE